MDTQVRRKVTIKTLLSKKERGEKIVYITAYDYAFSRLVDAAGVDVILVGDSLGMTVLGYDTTLPVTMDDMIRHSMAVRKGCTYAFLIGDMPFMSYQSSVRDAVLNAGRFIAEAGCDGVKLEGGRRVAPQARAIVDAGIVVQGHLGLTPQNALQFGGWRVQGKDTASVRAILEDALALEDAGITSLLLEGIPSEVAGMVRSKLSIPVYGIGAGRELDGQLVIIHDILGMYDRLRPKFVKQYSDVGAAIRDAVSQYGEEVRSGKFPAEEHFYEVDAVQLEAIRELSRSFTRQTEGAKSK